MSVSTLPNYLTEGKRLLFVKDAWTDDEISLMLLPNTFQSISCRSLREWIRNFDLQTPIPDAILVNLKSVSFNKISPILRQLKRHEILNAIPIIGLHCEDEYEEIDDLKELGFSDCFCQPFDWKTIEKRVVFLNRYKKQLTVSTDIGTDEIYRMPLGKRIFDIMVASTLLILLFPLFLVVSILIKLESKGSIFYSSKRVGTGYQIFDFIKFRSMREGADASLQQLTRSNSYGTKETSGKDFTFFKMKDDPRVTTVGKFIRKTSIDELPQLINVLKGEMSIVGNRPLPVYEAEKLTCDDWAKRFMAPAGLTGLWQVDERGKDNLAAEERIRLDMNYADNYSFFMDLKILMRTLPAMFQRE